MKLNDTQMELGLDARQACVSRYRRHRGMSRARWWFARMRQMVDSATDWEPAPPARPVQSSFIPLLARADGHK
jgi:hypothetical protein